MSVLAHYDLCLEEVGDIFVLRVTGTTDSATTHLRMSHSFAETLPEGHATFVRDLQLVDTRGETIAITGGGQDGWQISSTDAPLPWTWQYNVTLTHESLLPPAMRDESPHRSGDYAFWTTWAVFIYPDGDGEFTVSVGDGVPAVTPWCEAAESNLYRVTTLRELTEGFLIFGNYEIHTWQEYGSTIALTVHGEWRNKADTLIETVKRFLHEAGQVLGTIPSPRVLIAVETIDGDVLQGGVIGSSVSVCMPFLRDYTDTYRDVWCGFIGHELFHLWNGAGLRLEQDGKPEYWFSEGFTVYYQDVIAARLGWITREKYRANCEWSWQQYQSQADTVSLRTAGEDKGQYRPLIYDGGRIFAMLLDAKIVRESGGRANLDTLMHTLLQLSAGSTSALPTDEFILSVASVTKLPFVDMQQWFIDRLEVPNGMGESEFRQVIS